jgi:hypothetical protein
VETRYTGEPTLDEPVSKTIVRESAGQAIHLQELRADECRCVISTQYMQSYFRWYIHLKAAAVTSSYGPLRFRSLGATS